MGRIFSIVVLLVTAAFVCGCWESSSQEQSDNSAVGRKKAERRRIVEPKVRPKEPAAEAQPVAEAQPKAEAQPVAEAQPKARRPGMSAEERKALREKRREEFYRKVDAERNKTHEQRVQEHEDAMQRAQEKRDLQDERLKRILEKRAKQRQ